MFNILKLNKNSSINPLFSLKKTKFFALRKFSFTSQTDEVYPDEIICRLKELVEEKSDSSQEWNDIDYSITEKIHFFDADQYTDAVYLLSKHSNVSENLWELLSRKIFDYDLNIFQTVQLNKAIHNCDRLYYFSLTPLIRNNASLRNDSNSMTLCEKLLY